MKIVMLHGSNDLYGASRVLVDDVRIFVAAGATVDVVVPSAGPLDVAVPGAGGRLVVDDGLRVLRRSRGPLGALPARLPPVCDGADVIVIWTLALAAYLPLVRATNARSVLAVHEILDGPLGRLLAWWGRSFAAAIVTNSHATSRWLGGKKSRDGEVLYPIAPPYAPVPPPEGPPSVLLAGRVNGNKGHLLAVDAVERVRSDGTALSLVLAGAPFPGQEEHRAALLARIEELPWAAYVGERPDIYGLLAETSALVVGSTTPEPFGIVCLEAWSRGRTVLAPDFGGVAEAVRLVEGLTYQPGDVDSLAGALRLLVDTGAYLAAPSGDAPAASTCSEAARAAGWSRVLGW